MANYKVVTVGLCAGLVLLTSCTKLQSRDQMNQGVKAYKNNKYPDAVRHFKEAVQLDPANENAQAYLATSYMIQWVPGADNPDNQKNYNAAKQEFSKILQKEPSNSLALASMASMAYESASAGNADQRTAAMEEARKWNDRRVEVDPKDAEAYYYLGVIDWSEAFPALRDERIKERMNANDPGPLKDPKAREEFKAKYQKEIDAGIEDLKKCLAIDKENEDAMSYMNLLLRKKADLEDSPDASKADIAQAEDWSNKSVDMKRIKLSRPAKKTEAT